jgi:mitochondrial fission protein ELM1
MPVRSAPPQCEDPPTIWVITSYRAGENAQILALAEALGTGCEVKRIAYRRLASLSGLLRRVSLAGIDSDQSSPLRPPWPALIISAGMRNEPVCRWIRRQSGGRTRLVFIGRTWAEPDTFDLIVTTPQYRLRPHPHILQNELTLHGITPQRLQQAAAGWESRLGHLPEPRIAVVVGGNSGPYTLGPRAARRLGGLVSEMAAARGGSLLVTTSARTPPRTIAPLRAALSVPAHFFAWSPDARDNPYTAYLALAREIVVTADSIAMLSEACATGKPVYLFDPNRRRESHDFRMGGSAYRLLMRIGPQRLTRDVGRVHARLVAAGHAAWLGESAAGGASAPPDDMARALARVRQLLEVNH